MVCYSSDNSQIEGCVAQYHHCTFSKMVDSNKPKPINAFKFHFQNMMLLHNQRCLQLRNCIAHRDTCS